MSNSVEQRAIDTAARAGFTSEEAEKSLIGSIAMNYDKCVHIVSELSEDPHTERCGDFCFLCIFRIFVHPFYHLSNADIAYLPLI